MTTSLPLLAGSPAASPVPAFETATSDAAARNAADGLARRKRIAWLDAAKGVGILLVVIGHCLGGLHDAGLVGDHSPAWLAFYFIYTFHMPLFFFLSGSLVYSRVVNSPRRFLRGTVTKIAYPYFLWGAVQTLVLVAAAKLVNHPVPTSPVHDVIGILWQPPGQFWFLYVLFFLHLLAAASIRLGGKLLLATVLAALYVVCVVSDPVTHVLTHYIAGTNILFYAVGVCFGDFVVKWRGELPRPRGLLLIAVLVFVGSTLTGWMQQGDFYTYATLPAAIAGTAIVLGLARETLLSRTGWIGYLGRQSMPIYVLHVIFVAGTRIVLMKAFGIDNVWVILPIIFVVGVIAPVCVSAVATRLRLHQALGLG